MKRLALALLLAACGPFPPEPCDGADLRYWDIANDCEQHMASRCAGRLPEDCEYARECARRFRARCDP